MSIHSRFALLAVVALLARCGADPGVEDAGLQFDAGSGDAGITAPDDAGADGGAPEDSGVVDAGLVADGGAGDDAGVPDAGPVDAGVRCQVGAVPGTCMDVALCTGTRSPTAGLCPGPAAIQCCTPRYANACDPNVVAQPNASLPQTPGDGGCPDGMLRVTSFCVDQYEASLDEVLPDGGLRPWSPFINPGSTPVRARSTAGAVPQGYVNQLQAGVACARAGKRLCTDAEWLRACRGPTSLVYPYGNTRLTGVCNDARSVHPAVELYGTSASWIYSHIDSPCLNQLPASLDRTGANAGCVTGEGLFDLMGNLHEWTADPNGTFRGGFYVDTVVNGNGCLYATTAHDVSHWDYSTGFRCCAD